MSIKNDNIHVMLRTILSVQKNVPDARTIIFDHAYRTIDAIHSELRPNARLLHEAFPTIIVDLAFVSGCFNQRQLLAPSRFHEAGSASRHNCFTTSTNINTRMFRPYCGYREDVPHQYPALTRTRGAGFGKRLKRFHSVTVLTRLMVLQ
ncbi:hypothetical protein EI94DRAFT_283601 [Lactarius quietus]|nr:hypothetical protein EI94DRAFT_283601 [Lactarius quietus]